MTKIAIKNPALSGSTLTKWGDYHFGASLQHALEQLGASVVQHYWPEWEQDEGEDVVLYLRGKRYCRPPEGKLAAIWIISHPATVTPEELDAFDLVYSASARFHDLIRDHVQAPVEVMRQCTDTRLFGEKRGEGDLAARSGEVFVANSRGVLRDIMQWALETGLRPTLIGRHWDKLGLGELVLQEYIDNRDLPSVYRAFKIGLNDHWGDMKHYGMINNRVFDCLACGLPVISDGFPELAAVCGDGVVTVDDARSYWDAIWASRTRYPEMLDRARSTWRRLAPDYTFDARAAQFMGQIESLPRKNVAVRAASSGTPSSRAPTWLQEALDEALAAYRKSRPEAQMAVLHVCPSVEGAAYLASREDVQVLSCGPGSGPWQFPLDPGLAHLPERRFRAIFIEDMASWSAVKDKPVLFEAMARCLAQEGAVHASDPQVLAGAQDILRGARDEDEAMALNDEPDTPGMEGVLAVRSAP